MGAKLLLAVLMKGQNMELIIRSMIKQYYSKLQIKVVNIESVLALLFAMLSFTIFAFAIASSNNLKLLFILLACIFVVASQILSAISDNKYYKSKTSITNKKEKLIMLNELLQSNNLIDLSNKEKLKCFYKHVEKYYDENNEKITKAEALFNKSAAVIIIPVTFEKQGIHHDPKTILRVMQKYNLLSVIRRKRYRKYGEHIHRYPNLLNRDFKAERPNQKWVTDISYIKTGQGTLYLSVIRDLYDNSIVAYKTGTEQNINLVLRTIKAAKRKEKITAELQLHSDQGFQYTSQAYFNLTKSYGITPSMSRRGNPYDNAMAENFFSILKTECVYRTKLRTYEEARLLIGQYIDFYNNERIQLKTKLTPLEKRSQYVA